MTKERKTLLIILEFLALGLLWQAAGGFFKEKSNNLKEKILLNNQREERFRMAQSMQEEKPVPNTNAQKKVEDLLKYYDLNPDLYRMGQNLNREWQRQGLTLIQFEERENGEGSFLEYRLEGNPQAFLAFLNNPGIPVRISRFTIESQGEPCTISLGIAPAGIPENIPHPWKDKAEPFIPPARQFNPSSLAALFPQTAPKVRKPPSAQGRISQAEEGAPETLIPLQDRLIYIGRVKTGESGMNWGFKESVSGRIILVGSPGRVNKDGWSLSEESETLFLLNHGEKSYEVKK